MARQGYDLQLTRYDEQVYTSGVVRTPPTSAIRHWVERTPWHAVQGAAQDALRRASVNG